MARPRILFLDVDGTLIDHRGVIAPSTVAAIAEVRAAGHRVYLCTGRSAADIPPAVRGIEVDGAVTNGGARVTDGDAVVREATMSRDLMDRVLAYAETAGLDLVLQGHRELWATDRVIALVAHHRDRLPEGASLPLTGIAPIAEADLGAVAKVTFASADPDALAATQTALGDAFLVIDGSLPLPGGSSGELSELGVDKGSGIRAVLEHLGADAADAIGIGDGWNDREMFEVVGTAVAMGQAPAELQALADHVTTGVQDDGVANALALLGLVSRA